MTASELAPGVRVVRVGLEPEAEGVAEVGAGGKHADGAAHTHEKQTEMEGQCTVTRARRTKGAKTASKRNL